MKTVTLMRIRTNDMGALPNGFRDGMIVGVTDQEIETLNKNPHLRECFEEIQIKGISNVTVNNNFAPTNPSHETAPADAESSLSTEQPTVDRKT